MNWLAGLLSIGVNIDYDSGNRSPAARESPGWVDERRAAEERARTLAGYRNAANAGTKYSPNAEDKELIGITDAILFWATESGVDNSTDDDGNSGLHLTIFDTTTRADSAQIKLLNDSGDTQYVVAAAIKAKPIIRMSGEQGYTHDSFVDYQDIFLNGENTFEFGNNFVVTKAQLEQLADYYAKTLGVIATSGNPKAKHIYAVSIPGRCWWFEPGEWYTIQVGGAGQREYIDSVVECYDVTVDAAADSLGTTNIAFREVEQNWVKDSNAMARFLATGDPRWKPNNFGRVVVAAKDYLGVADYYCDGTADQTEIQAAIDYLANAFGGGMVELTDGTFFISAAIEIADNIMLLGSGKKTTLERNCNDYCIEIIGTSSNAISNIELSNFVITINAADTNQKDFIYGDYAENVLITSCGFIDTSTTTVRAEIYFQRSNRVQITKSVLRNGYNGIYLGLSGTNAQNESIIEGCHFYDFNSTAIGIYSLEYIKISTNTIRNATMSILISDGKHVDITNNTIFYIEHFAITGRGIHFTNQTTSEDCIINGNTIKDITEYGVYLDSNCIKIQIAANKCSDNGNFIDRGNCESATPPAADGEVTDTLTQCTYTRSDVQEYANTYSYLLTKTVAAGTAATAYLTDNANTNDLHGLYASQEYRFGAWVYIPSGGMLGSELTLVIRDYVAAWEEQAQACANTYDEWQYVEVTKTLRAGSGGATFGFAIASAAADTETAYTDNLRLTPMGTGNLHNQNFYDAGTDTYTGV